MIYIYAPSMATISFVANYWSFDDLNVITYNSSILEFCTKMGINCIEIQHNTNTTFKGLKAHKEYIISFSKRFENQKIHFGIYGFDYWGLFLLFQLSKKNTISFFNVDFEYKALKINMKSFFAIPLQRIIDLSLLRIMTKLPLSLFFYGGNEYFIGIKTDILNKKFPFNGHSSKTVLENNKNHILNKYDIKPFKAVFIDQGNTVYSIDNSIIDVLKNRFSCSELLIKEHPNFNLSNIEFNYFNSIPREIPIELIINDDIIIIGISSTALINSINNIRISIIQLIEWNDIEVKNIFQNLLTSEVHTPNSIMEFTQILSSVGNSGEVD